MKKIENPVIRQVASLYFSFKRKWYKLRYPNLIMAKDVLIKGTLDIEGSVSVSIASGCSLGKEVKIFGSGQVTIGENVFLNGCWLGCDRSITIQSDCLISDCYILDTDYHNLDPTLRRAPLVEKGSAPIIIEQNAWIGANATVMKGVTIGRDSVVGLGTVVRQSVPPGVVVIGNPHQIVKYL
jgi:acetyltransferase-like isoleucine patch superfamily enzyme